MRSMRTAYLDDSAKEANQGPAFVLAGWVASAQVWTEFEAAWNSVLGTHAALAFHHTDLRARKRGYEAFDEAKADALLSDLVGVIEKHPLDGYVVTLHHASFVKMWDGIAGKVTKEQLKRLNNKAFTYCFHAMMQTILQDSKERRITEPFDVVLDGQDREVVESVDMLEEFRPHLPAESKALLGVVSRDGTKSVGIQAADLLASRIALNLKVGAPCAFQERIFTTRRIVESAVGHDDMKRFEDALQDLRKLLGSTP